MITLFNNIEDLRKVVKVGASMPWSSIEPYINDAVDIYLPRHLGREVVDKITADDAELVRLLRRAVGPLAFYLGADEMGVNIGDSGITVQNDHGHRSPASDAKIAAAKRSMLGRGYAALSEVIDYLITKGNVPKGSPLHRRKLCLVDSLSVFEEVVSINGCYVSYFELLPLMLNVQHRLCAQFPPIASLVGKQELTAEERNLHRMVVCCIVFNVAYIHTSNATRQQRASAGKVEWSPVLRPLFVDTTDHGNYYRQEAEDYRNSIASYIEAHAEAFGMKPLEPMRFNSQERKIFYSEG